MSRKVGLLIVVFLGVLIIFYKISTSPGEDSYKFNLWVGEKKLKVEVASTPRQWEQGLSGRKNLCWDCGLLFVFDKPGFYTFWMKDMYFDIDILWIADKRVVDVTYSAKAPPKEERENPKTVYRSKVLVDKVLEVKAGWVEKNRIKVGDKVEVKR